MKTYLHRIRVKEMALIQIFLFALLLAVSSPPLSAQTLPAIQWNKTFSGDNGIASINLTADDNYMYERVSSSPIIEDISLESRGEFGVWQEKATTTLTGDEHKSTKTAFHTPNCLTPSEGMTGWWSGDRNANDLIGRKNGILRGDASTGSGFVNDAFVLDGNGDFIEVPDDLALNVGTGDFTVDLWVHFNTTSGEQVLAEKYIEDFSAIPPGWTFTKLDGNTLYFGTGPGPIDHGVYGFSPLIQENTWIHLAIRRSSNMASIFVNGSEIASALFIGDLNCSSSLKFGHRGDPNDTPGSLDGGGYYVNGKIDEVGYYVGKALSNEEVKAIYTVGSKGKCKPNISNITSFTLINADSNADIGELKDGHQIDLDALGFPTLSVRANTEPTAIDSILFELISPGFSSLAVNWNQYQLVGDAFITDDRYAVSPNERNTKSAVWNKNQIDLTHSFDFTFTITDCWEGNGMNFVLQQAGLMALGGYEDHHEGADHGYYNSPTDIFNPSLAVELDFYNNSWGNPNNPYYDPVNMNYHMTLVKNGHPAPISNLVELSTQISNCADRLFRVVWNSITKQLQVYLDGKLMLSHTEDVVNTIFKGKSTVYFGFTGASGAVSGLETFHNTNLIYNGSVTAPATYVKVERVLPYALYGDAKGGKDYLGQYWLPGQYTLKATPYWKGSASLAQTINFEVKTDLSQALQVNFGNKNTTPPQGWVRDYGLAFGEKTFYRYGWKRRDTGEAIDLSLAGSFPGSPGNGRHRSSPKDVLLATLMHMQGNHVKNFRGTPVEAYWELQVENGEYLVTVSVGDGAVYTSTDPESHSINVEGVPAITRFMPQGAQGNVSRFKQAITKVTVSDGYLTLDADGGTNTKINYAVIQPVSNKAAIARVSANPLLQAAETQAQIRTFPNPFSDQFQLTTRLAGTVTVSVYDLMGNSYYQATHQTATGELLLDLSAVEMKPGVYLLKLQATDGSSQVTKVLKK